MAGTMLIVDIDIKPGRVGDFKAAAGDIVRIDVVGDHSDELYAELEGMNPLHVTKLGGITR